MKNAETSSGALQILAVSDDAQLLKAIGSILRANGCVVLVARRGEDCLEIVRRNGVVIFASDRPLSAALAEGPAPIVLQAIVEPMPSTVTKPADPAFAATTQVLSQFNVAPPLMLATPEP